MKLYHVLLLPIVFGNTFCMEEVERTVYTYSEHSVSIDIDVPNGEIFKVVAAQPGEALPAVPVRTATPSLEAKTAANPLNLPPATIQGLKADLTQELAAAVVADPKTPEEIAAQEARCKKIKMMLAILGVTAATSAFTAGFAYLGVSLQ